jgi:hypothetical protein
MRMFVVEREYPDDCEIPPEFDDVVGYRYAFWDETRYHSLINELSHDLAKEIQKMQRTETYIAKIRQEPSLQGSQSPVILLADVTDDLYSMREEIEQVLRQANVQVLPEEDYYPYKTGAFQQAVRADLAKSHLFIQLLSEFGGRKLKGLQQSRPRCQYELALEAEKPIIQWRAPELDLRAVQDPDQRDLLQRETVRNIGIKEFTDAVLQQVTPQEPSVSHDDFGTLGILLFLDANTDEDAPLITQICEVLNQFGVGYVLPLQSEKPTENREAFKQYVLECDALVIVYGKVSLQWVTSQLLEVRKIFRKRKQPSILAVFDGPPEQKPPLNIKFPNMRILYCRDCMDEQKLLEFIESLPKERAADL